MSLHYIFTSVFYVVYNLNFPTKEYSLVCLLTVQMEDILNGPMEHTQHNRRTHWKRLRATELL